MEKEEIKKTNISKFALIGTLIFVVGIFIGSKLENYSIDSLQAYLLNSIGFATNPNATMPNATSSNATSSNATSSNATTPNATMPNATTPNATNGNVNKTDNILYLESFNFKATSIKPGEKLYLEINTKGATKTGGSISFKNVENDTSFNVKIESINNNPYVEMPNNISKGEYKINEIMLVGLNSDKTTFSKRYSGINSNVDYFLSFLDKIIKVEIEELKKEETNQEKIENNKEITKQETQENIIENIILEKIEITQKEIEINEKLYVSYKTNIKISNMKLTFMNEKNEKITAYVKSLNNNPYIEIPTDTIIGNYYLYSINISTKDTTKIYSLDGKIKNSEKYNFNINITINDIKQQDIFIYNNEDLTNELITKLYDSKSTATININTNSNSIINQEIFNVIKGTEKKLILNYNDNQIVFIGNDIKNAKSIDASVKTNLINTETEIGKLINDGFILDFVSNGDLPGKAQIRIKITDEIKEKFNQDLVNVYYFNSETNKFKEIALNIKPTEDEYYEFELEHNSQFVITKNKLDTNLLDLVDDNVVDFQKSDKTNLSILGITITFIAIIGVVITTILIIEKNKKNKIQN